jgi:hypothetical protein
MQLIEFRGPTFESSDSGRYTVKKGKVADACCVCLAEFEAPISVAIIITEQNTLDRLNIWRQMLVSDPITDCPFTAANRVRKFSFSPRSTRLIDFSAGARAPH